MNKAELARYIDHAILKPEMARNAVQKEIETGLAYNVLLVCVRPPDISLALDICKETQTSVGSVVGFPHGSGLSELKGEEAGRLIDMGVSEIDMVVNYSLVRGGFWNEFEADIRAVAEPAKRAKITLKTIFETAILSKDEIKQCTEVAITAGVDLVKTSTGFGFEGANEEDVQTMLDIAAGRVGVKASGGIRTFERACRFLEMGATRLGIGSTATPVICGDASDLQTQELY